MLAVSGNPLFSRQGHWDGGSTLHCVAMALALLGKLNDPVYLPYHTFGPEQIVWDDAWAHYLNGLTLGELASFVSDLDLGVRPVSCTASGVELFRVAERELHAGWPIIVGWQQRHPVKWRAALGIGTEGSQNGRAFDSRALLLLDTAGNDPGLAGFNARLDRHGNDQFRYQSAAAKRSVNPLGGISIRTVVNAVTNA